MVLDSAPGEWIVSSRSSKLVCSKFRDCGEEHDDAEDETVVQEDEPKATDDAEDISVREARARATEDVAVLHSGGNSR